MSIASAAERYFVSLVNASRASYGLDPLRIETALNQSADAHSAWMLSADVFSHTGRGGSSPTDRMRAAGLDLDGRWMTSENIAYRSVTTGDGLNDDVRALHRMFMDSPSHRANILNPDAEVIGIGLKVGDFTRDNQDYKVLMVTQNFAATDGDVDIDYSNGLPRLPLPDLAVTQPGRAAWLPHFDGQTYLSAPSGSVRGTSRGDDIRLGGFDTFVRAGSGHDWIAGGNGDDTLEGQGGNDRVLGQGGNDRLVGGLGNDLMHGGNGDDLILGKDGNDRLTGGAGADLVYGGAGNDRIAGGSGDDRLVGVGGDDYLAGNDGDDRLEGRGGDDTLRGAAGNDTLIGGAGADSFIFGPGGGVDRVADFDPIEDRVMIARSAIGTSDANFISDAIRETVGGVIVELLDADRIVFVGESLSAQDVTNAIYLV